MRKVLFSLILFLFILFQISLLPYLAIVDTYPNIILLSGVVLVLFGRTKIACLVVTIGGLILDLLSPFRLGLLTLSLALPIFTLTFVFSKIFFKPSGIIVFLAFLFTSLLYELLTRLFFHSSFSFDFFISILYAGLLGTVLYYIALKIINPIELKDQKHVHL